MDNERDKPRGLAALLAMIGLAPQPEEDAHPDLAAAALREQAEVFQTMTVGEVMTPRADIEALELSSTFEAVVAAFAESEHSRMPVFRESLDDPVGFVHLRDVFKLLANPERRRSGGVELPRLKRETLFVPASMRAADLMVRMQSSRVHIAMVIDEFGGVDGLVTLEDVIEAVVGEIDDEHDKAAAVGIVVRAGGIFEVDGRVPLEDLEAALHQDLATPDLGEEIDTVAGLVTDIANRVPQRGEVIAHPSGLEFEVTDADPRRVKRVRIRPATTPIPE